MISTLTQGVFNISQRRRRWILLLAVTGFSGYGAYRIYHLPFISSKRRKLFNFARDLVSIAHAVSSSANSVILLSSDLNRFLLTDSDEIPSSFKQLTKIARSDEFSAAIERVSEAVTVGIIRGTASSSDSKGFSDKLIEKLLSSDGSGFASVVVGSFAKNMVSAYNSGGEVADSSCVQRWVNIISDYKCRELISDVIQRFVGTAVAVYLDKTMEVNTYDELFSGLTNPRHEAQVKDVLVSVCNGAVETLVRTSHEVLTRSNSDSSQNLGKYCKDCSDEKRSGWVDRCSSVLAVPSNKRFVLDVTGRLTFQYVRSFLEFLLWKFEDGVKRGVTTVHDEIIGRGLDVVRYLSAKSMLVFSLCFALCIRFATGPRTLMPA